MKTLKYVLVLFSLFATYSLYSQTDTLLHEGFANIATLIVDYDTYQFEGGDLSFYTCSSCNNDSLPFAIDVNYPGDFGGITFKIASTFDTIFDAAIVWMGTGQIIYPYSFSMSYPFNAASGVVEQPTDITYWGFYGDTIVDTQLLNKADSAWEVIDDLEITNVFSKIDYKVGIYLYPPTVGMFEPSVAKWVIFLYSYVSSNSVELFPEDVESYYVYPNPAKDIISVREDILSKAAVNYKIFDVTGDLVLKGKINSSANKINLNSLPSGLYLLEIIKGKSDKITVQKLIVE